MDLNFEARFKKRAMTSVVTAAAVALATTANAAGTATGVEAGFFEMSGIFTTLIEGAGGYLLLIISVIVGAVTLAVTGRWGSVIIAFAVAMFLGYGIPTITAMGGVTADVDMLTQIDATPPTIKSI